MWADIERFDIEELIAADPGGPGGRRRARGFAVQLPELTSVPVHWHDYYELGYVLEGHARHVVNGVEQLAAPGTVFLLSPADFHAIERSGTEPLTLLNAVLHPRLVEQTLESVIPGGDLGAWSRASLPGVAEDVRRICRESSTRTRGWEVVVESALRGILVELARCSADGDLEASQDVGGAGPPAHVRRALRYVERHFREPLTLAQVAAVAHLSPHWFSEQFRRGTGESFQSYLRGRRLEFAHGLLDSTELGITEVCHAAGFNDPSYFGRAYRARYGYPPSKRPPPPGAGHRSETFAQGLLTG